MTKPNPEQSGDGKLQGLSETASYLAYPKEVLMMKKIILGALVLFIFTFSFHLFLDWDNDNEHRYALMIDGYYIEDMSTTYDPTQNLVPEGSILTSGDVDEITYTYDLLVIPERTVDSEFESLILRTAEGEVPDMYGLFNVETRTLEHQTLDHEDYDRMTVESTITLSRPKTAEQSAFLNNLQSLSFNVTLNAEE